MLTLNLISKELKKEITLRRIYRLLKRNSYILVIIIVLVATALVAAKGILQTHFNRVVEETTIVTKSSQSYNSKVRDIQAKLNIITQIQDEFVPWSYLLENLVKATPENVTLTHAGISKDNQTIQLKGVAVQRQSLLQFKENLQNSNIFYQIDLPIGNILTKDNIFFDITAKFKTTELSTNDKLPKD